MPKTRKKEDPFGKMLDAELKSRDMSVAQLARKLGIPRDRIYKWIDGSEPKYADRIAVQGWMGVKSGSTSEVDNLRIELTVQRANVKVLIHTLVKLMSKVYGRPLEECLEEMENDIKLATRDRS